MKKLLLFTALLILLIGCGSGGGSNNEIKSTTNKTLFSIYLTGSDLESENALGTEDLQEILLGYNQLSLSNKNTIDIRVAVGGSKAENWEGVKYLDTECLITDLENKKIGDNNCYSYQNTNSNMGDAQTLTDFLTYLNQDRESYDKTIFIFWNHGGGYTGVCYDEAFNDDQLTLEEIEESFLFSEASFDIIGMDACLMGNLEVANSIKNYGNYLVASEELEPGHGWDYIDLISWIGANSNAQLKDIGIKFVDSYIDSSKHISTNNKTLSLVDLKAVDSFIEKFDTLFTFVDSDTDYSEVLTSSSEAQKFGVDESNDVGRSVDLKSFIERLKEEKNSIEIDAILTEFDSLVLYNRYQKKESDSNGISIFQPLNSEYWDSTYKESEEFVSNDWYNFVGGFLTKGLDDTIAPTTGSETKCSYEGAQGYCIEASDNIGIKEASEYNLLIFGSSYLLLGSDYLQKTDNNTYFLPKPGDSWLFLCNGESNSSDCNVPSAFFTQKEGDIYQYYSYAKINGKNSTFFIEIDKNSSDIEYWSVELDESGIPSKQQHTLEIGDTVGFYYYIVSGLGYGYWQLSGELNITKPPTLTFQEHGATTYNYGYFEDFKGNQKTSGLRSSK